MGGRVVKQWECLCVCAYILRVGHFNEWAFFVESSHRFKATKCCRTLSPIGATNIIYTPLKELALISCET